MYNQENKDRQAELFDDYSCAPQKNKRNIFNLPRLNLSLAYENIIIIGIAMIMLLVVCYSLGVEKGKALTQAQIRKAQLISQDKADNRQSEKDQESEREAPQPKQKKPRVKLAQETKGSSGSAYIQVASFLSDKYAEKEMLRLKNRGYQAFTSKWGKYRVVCVGRYQDEIAAKEALTELKGLYQDCILRNK